MALNSRPKQSEPIPVEIPHESVDSTIAIEINKLQRQTDVMRAARLLHRFEHIIQEAQEMLTEMKERNKQKNRDLINKQHSNSPKSV